MRDSTGIILLFVCIAVILAAGCVGSSTSSASSYQPAATPTMSLKQSVTLESVECAFGEYGWLYCKGTVSNGDVRSHSVSGYIDVYDKDVKYDHMLFFVNVDAKGKTSFESTSTDAENHGPGTYRYYIDRVY
jgi:hypothetical protein